MKNMDKNTISDVMNCATYTYAPNLLHLILFADAATYNKSGNRSQWFVFSAIAELPPIKRYEVENVVFHSSWSGSNPDFNIYLQKYNSEIDTLIKDGLVLNGTHYKFKVHIFIGDAPCRSKSCNSNSFNGKYGCIKCLHPTIYNTKTIYPKLDTVRKWEVIKKDRFGQVISITRPFKDLDRIRNRSKYIYNQQVLEAVTKNETYQGIKGFSYLSNWVDIPRMILFDKMHMSDIGTFKSIFFLLLDSNNKEYSLSKLKC
jgi:hypothetical protein